MLVFQIFSTFLPKFKFPIIIHTFLSIFWYFLAKRHLKYRIKAPLDLFIVFIYNYLIIVDEYTNHGEIFSIYPQKLKYLKMVAFNDSLSLYDMQRAPEMAINCKLLVNFHHQDDNFVNELFLVLS